MTTLDRAPTTAAPPRWAAWLAPLLMITIRWPLLMAGYSLFALLVLFALERRWPPYHDRLAARLVNLGGQGWPPGYLTATLLKIVQTGAPTLQQELEARAEARVRARGYEVDLWEGEIACVKAWRFA
jgi:hypothetical protein